MTYKYIKKENEYILLNGNEEIHRFTGEIGICFDYHPEQTIKATLLKHGESSLVTEYYKTCIEKYKNSGFDDFADGIIVISGHFPIEKVNKCISHTGFISTYYEELMRSI